MRKQSAQGLGPAEKTGLSTAHCEPACSALPGRGRDEAELLYDRWRAWTLSGDALWRQCLAGPRTAETDAALEQASEEAFAIEDRLASAPAATLSGIAGKLRIFAHHCRRCEAEPSPEERLVLSALADLERLAGRTGPA